MPVNTNTKAHKTVMRLRLRSTTVDPAAVEFSPPPNMSDRPPPRPLCRSTRTSNSTEAMKPLTMTVNGNTIAFIGCNWFGANWASDRLPGSARCGKNSQYELDLITAQIREAKAKGYLVIATIQYEEYYTYTATPNQKRDFQALRDAGAVVVNGSQGHHAQGFNVNEKGFIHYGTGNLFFGDQFDVGAHQTFIDRHIFYDGDYLGVEIKTAYIDDYSQPRPMRPNERAALLKLLFSEK